MWAPGYFGITGNEEADALAKAGAMNGRGKKRLPH